MNPLVRLSQFLLPGLALLVLGSCHDSATDNRKAPADSAGEPKAVTDSVISEFSLRESLLTASRSYKVTSADDPSLVSYVTLNTSVQWPDALGKYKIDNLRDSIITLTFGAEAPKDIRKAITRSVTDLGLYGLEGKVETIDTIPKSAEMGEYYSTRTLQLIECTQHTVTYSATSSDYMGGAHPNSSAIPFTFVLDSDRAVTMDYLFTAGAMKELEPMILEAIAISHSMSVKELKDALLNSPVSVTNNVYIINGNIAFHYNPYDILPYSFGPSEAFIAPYAVEKYLTPEARKLLLE